MNHHFVRSNRFSQVADRPAEIGVVIVNFMKASRLLRGLQSLRMQELDGPLAIVVLDNSCNAAEERLLREAEQALDFRLIVSERNLGYPGGCNRAISALPRTRYVLLMSPDILWQETDSLQRLLTIARRTPNLGVMSPSQCNDDGSKPEIARSFPTLQTQIWRRLAPSLARKRELPQPRYDRASEATETVDWLQSSCALVSRELLDRIGGLDERYFLFMSDVELCLHAWQAGMIVQMTGAVEVRADGVRASKGGLHAAVTNPVQRAHLRDALRFYFAHGFRRLDRSHV